MNPSVANSVVNLSIASKLALAFIYWILGIVASFSVAVPLCSLIGAAVALWNLLKSRTAWFAVLTFLLFAYVTSGGVYVALHLSGTLGDDTGHVMQSWFLLGATSGLLTWFAPIAMMVVGGATLARSSSYRPYCALYGFAIYYICGLLTFWFEFSYLASHLPLVLLALSLLVCPITIVVTPIVMLFHGFWLPIVLLVGGPFLGSLVASQSEVKSKASRRGADSSLDAIRNDPSIHGQLRERSAQPGPSKEMMSFEEVADALSAENSGAVRGQGPLAPAPVPANDTLKPKDLEAGQHDSLAQDSKCQSATPGKEEEGLPKAPIGESKHVRIGEVDVQAPHYYAPEIQFLRQERADGKLESEWIADLERVETVHRQHHGEVPTTIGRKKGLRVTFPNGRRATLVDFADYLPSLTGTRLLFMDLMPAKGPNEPPIVYSDPGILTENAKAMLQAWEHSADNPAPISADGKSKALSGIAAESIAYRFRLKVVHWQGVEDYAASSIMKTVRLVLPGVPISVIYQDEEVSIETTADPSRKNDGLMGLMVLCASEAVILEFRVQASLETCFRFRKAFVQSVRGFDGNVIFAPVPLERNINPFGIEPVRWRKPVPPCIAPVRETPNLGVTSQQIKAGDTRSASAEPPAPDLVASPVHSGFDCRIYRKAPHYFEPEDLETEYNEVLDLAAAGYATDLPLEMQQTIDDVRSIAYISRRDQYLAIQDAIGDDLLGYLILTQHQRR